MQKILRQYNRVWVDKDKYSLLEKMQTMQRVWNTIEFISCIGSIFILKDILKIAWIKLMLVKILIRIFKIQECD